MIIIIGGLARETGKTTIAVNLAVNRAQKKQGVAILDCEPDQAAMDWLKMRCRFGEEIANVPQETYQIDVFAGSGDITGMLNQLNRDYDHVLVDVGPRNLKALESGLQLADKLYVPLQLSEIYGKMRIIDLSEKIRESRKVNPSLRSYAFANRSVFIRNNPIEKIAETVYWVSYLSACDCFTSEWPIMEHEVIKQSSRLGLGCYEYPTMDEEKLICDKQEACDELDVLANHVFDDVPFLLPKGYVVLTPWGNFDDSKMVSQDS